MENVPNNIDLDPEMVMALREMCKANADSKVRELIELREKAEHDEASRLQHALKTGIEQGYKEGFEIGRKEGFEIGKTIGINEFNSNTALKWYNKVIDPKDISDGLEIDLEDILQIIDGHRNK